MRYRLIAALIVLTLIASLLAAPVMAKQADNKMLKPYQAKLYQAIVLKVIDGDTLEVRVKLWNDLEKTARLRIRGMDAPELRSPKCPQERAHAKKARDRLKQILGIKKRGDQPKILISHVAPGKYNRDVGHVFLTANGLNVADAMIAAKMARPYLKGRRGSWCQ